jgi:hypothetical protein
MADSDEHLTVTQYSNSGRSSKCIIANDHVEGQNRGITSNNLNSTGIENESNNLQQLGQSFVRKGKSQTEEMSMTMQLLSMQKETQRSLVEFQSRIKQLMEQSSIETARQFQLLLSNLQHLAAERAQSHAAGTLEGPHMLAGDVIMPTCILTLKQRSVPHLKRFIRFVERVYGWN